MKKYNNDFNEVKQYKTVVYYGINKRTHKRI